jgi:hypothetical protein
LITLTVDSSLTSPLRLNERRFRWVVGMFAGVLAVAGAWTLAVELARPSRSGSPFNQNFQAASEGRQQATRAAHYGMVRGDLWAELFFSFADLILIQSNRDFGAITTLNEALPAAERALSYAPFQSDVWLADMAEKYELPNPNATAALKMSYYTAPYKKSLAPLRLSVAVRSEALRDVDLSQFVEHDLRMILSKQLRPAIVAAYESASTAGQHFIETVVQDVDPSFLVSLTKPAR